MRIGNGHHQGYLQVIRTALWAIGLAANQNGCQGRKLKPVQQLCSAPSAPMSCKPREAKRIDIAGVIELGDRTLPWHEVTSVWRQQFEDAISSNACQDEDPEMPQTRTTSRPLG